LDRPFFGWEGGKCPPHAEQLESVNQALANVTDSICIQGELAAFAPCNNREAQCLDSVQDGQRQDVSNMWGAGVGLSFSDDGKQPWDPAVYGVKGIAFDLELFPEGTHLGDTGLNIRVQIPSVLPPDNTNVSYNQPFLTEGGSVVDTHGNLYACDSDGVSTSRVTSPTLEQTSSGTITSEQHPYGSSFWQTQQAIEAGGEWGPSPVAPSHNEFAWTQVAPPPGGQTYRFEASQILGVHFQVAHPRIDTRTTAFPFAFCINHLAFLLQ
jgi:hypothetical protein